MYQVSNTGNVKSFYNGNGQILKSIKVSDGYTQVCLCKEGKQKRYLIHRLVAQAFLDNPYNLPQVNHKDENKTNNKVDNLEWCDYNYNINFGTRNQQVSDKMTNGKLSKIVYQYSLDGELIKEWPSTNEIQRQLGYNQGNISKCCLGKCKTAYRYIWKYN